MEILDIINEHDEVVGSAPIDNIYKNKHHHRIVHVFVYNSDGKIGLQQRSARESFMPLHWGTSVGGHVLSGETFETAAHREAKEELGISLPSLTPLGKSLFITPHGIHKTIMAYRSHHDGPFTLDPEEGELFSFFDPPDLQKELDNGMKCMTELTHLLSHHFSLRV